jgi:hypothetical protein
MVSLITSPSGVDQDIPNPKRHARSFEPTEETKLIFLDPKTSEGKALRISSSLDPKIGSSARRLSQRECRRVWVESLRHARHTEESRRALLGHLSRLQDREGVVGHS